VDIDLERPDYMRLFKAIDDSGDRSINMSELMSKLYDATYAKVDLYVASEDVKKEEEETDDDDDDDDDDDGDDDDDDGELEGGEEEEEEEDEEEDEEEEESSSSDDMYGHNSDSEVDFALDQEGYDETLGARILDPDLDRAVTKARKMRVQVSRLNGLLGKGFSTDT
jgi:hypothetical protein